MTEPIDQATKDLIEKGAIKYAQKVGDYTKDFHDGINAKYAYIDGATVWAEKLKQLETQSHDQVRIIEHLEEKLKQERNKVIDECIDYFSEHYSELGDDGSYITWTTFEVQKKLESLKRQKS